jgi:hypothetical protein
LCGAGNRAQSQKQRASHSHSLEHGLFAIHAEAIVSRLCR